MYMDQRVLYYTIWDNVYPYAIGNDVGDGIGGDGSENNVNK